MKNSPFGDLRKRAAFDKKLSDGSMRLLIEISFIVHSESSVFTLTHKEAGKMIGLTDRNTIYSKIHPLIEHDYIECLGLFDMPAKKFYRLITGDTPKKNPMLTENLRFKQWPGLNLAAPSLGRIGGSKPKIFTAKTLVVLTRRIAAARKKRWPKKRSK